MLVPILPYNIDLYEPANPWEDVVNSYNPVSEPANPWGNVVNSYNPDEHHVELLMETATRIVHNSRAPAIYKIAWNSELLRLSIHETFEDRVTILSDLVKVSYESHIMSDDEAHLWIDEYHPQNLLHYRDGGDNDTFEAELEQAKNTGVVLVISDQPLDAKAQHVLEEVHSQYLTSLAECH